MNKKIKTASLSARNKKKNNHKHTTKVKGEKKIKKSEKRPKGPKKNIQYIGRQILSDEDLKKAKEGILERFKNRTKRTVSEDDEEQIQT